MSDRILKKCLFCDKPAEFKLPKVFFDKEEPCGYYHHCMIDEDKFYCKECLYEHVLVRIYIHKLYSLIYSKSKIIRTLNKWFDRLLGK